MFSLALGAFALALHLITQARANAPRIYVTTALVNFDARIVQGWSGGGGDRWPITNDSNHPFTGREYGGAHRWTLKGTPTFGSGYPYGRDDNSTIAGRDFPYGMWPIYWGNNTMGSDEYGPALDGLRPGGQLVTLPLRSTTEFYSDLRDGESYYIIADRDSAIFIMLSFVSSCRVLPAWPTKFDPISPNSTVKIENVISYYRASSFALASANYTNAFPFGDNNTESTNSTPLPDFIIDSEFHKCIDDVIQDALPIMNWPPGTEDNLKIGDIMGIVFGILGIPILIGLFWMAICIFLGIGWIVRSINRLFASIHWKLFGAKQEAKRQHAIALAERAETLKYEQFP